MAKVSQTITGHATLLKKRDEQGKESTFVIVRIVLVALLFLIVAVTAFIMFQLPVGERGFVRDARNLSEIPNIKVRGEGKIFVKPDIALFSLGVETERDTVEDAAARNSEMMNDIIDFLKASGVSTKDIKTTHYSIAPRYETDRDGKRTLAGYVVSQNVQVKIRDFSLIGSILSGAAQRGATNVGSLRFSVENEEVLRKEARDLAIADAKQKARELAGKLGVGLGKVIAFNEEFAYVPPIERFSAEGVFPTPAPAPTIEPGENEISVSVTITYEIR